MGARPPFVLSAEHFTIEGTSRAGHETWFRVRELGIALDIGRCPDALIATPNILISHAHLDHSVGIPFYAGQRHLQRMPGGNVIVPAETVADFEELMRIHSRLEGTGYDISFVGMTAGDEYRLSRQLILRAHEASHRVPARSWEILERRHHLRPEFAGSDGATLARLKDDGVQVMDDDAVSLLYYTGDTDRAVLERGGAIFESAVLMIECSFVAEGHEDRAARYRHIHFDDIAEFAERFNNRVIVLTHFSRRYSHEEIVKMLRKRCPAAIRDRIRLALPEPWQRL